MNPHCEPPSDETPDLTEALLPAEPARPVSRAAVSAWAARSIRERIEVIRSFRHLLATKAAVVAQSVSRSTGRPSAEILAAELLPLVDACRFLERRALALLSPRRHGARGRPLWLFGAEAVIHREPHGVVLLIAPSNYPLLLPGVQLLQALAAGNGVLLKPGLGATAATQVLLQLAIAAGLPPGIVGLLPEDPRSVTAAIEGGVDKVVFTGSARAGTHILAQLAPQAIPATMELSGLDAAIIRADADLDLAVRALVFGLSLNAARTCIAPRRVFVARTIATEFEGRLAAALAAAPRAALSTHDQQRLLPLLTQALTGGAHLLAGRVSPQNGIDGPIVVAGLNAGARLLREEFFAPVLGVVTVTDDLEAVREAGKSRFALGATIFSRDETGARELAGQLNAGMIVINDMIVPTADARLPFGGRRLSGFGVTRGAEGLLEMTRVKVVTLRRGAWRPHFAAPQPADANLFAAYLSAFHGSGLRRRGSALIRLCRLAFQARRTSKPSSIKT